MSGSYADPQQTSARPEPRARPARPDARRLALKVLLSLAHGHKFVQERLDEIFGRIPLSWPDKALLNELVFGVVRHRATLDAVIDTFSKVRSGRIEPAVRDVLRLGIYQLVMLDRIPESAAVNTSVELAKEVSAGGHGFVNAMLRAVARGIEAKGLETLSADRARHGIRAKSGKWCVFRQPILPPPDRNPAAHLAAALSHPEWLVKRWVERMGQDRAVRLCEANNRVRPIFLRCNVLRTTRADLLARLRAAGTPACEGPHDLSLAMDSRVAVAEIPGFAEGFWQVQDVSSMCVVDMLGVTDAQRVLDLCAAPGGKASHMAELMSNRGMVVAMDRSPGRLRLVRENCQRLGLHNIRLVTADARHLPLRVDARFDRVLVDAPCSNTGVLSRRPEARWRLSPEGLTELATLQRELLTAGVVALREGGRAVYSTCSIEPEENEQVVAKVLAEHPELELEREERFLPHQSAGDGGYAAVLLKRSHAT
ncbi:MAG: 16S rRNA (cytosine(967)-C(5))-methyltransferase RsmB [Planctomycetes bacterium]|nr:16S rRNA (cytosine(967)-C(5))-methyltransferase RsmB [Planctomycetota bacterium]